MKTDKIISTVNRNGHAYGIGESGDTYRLITGTGLPPWWDFVCGPPEARE